MDVDPGLMTFAEFQQVADPTEGHFELHRGRIVHMPPRTNQHLKLQQSLLDVLTPRLRSRGFLTAELPFRPVADYEAWVAGIGFVSQTRWDAHAKGYFAGAPDLVVELLSNSNDIDEIIQRQEMCRRNGCDAFWTIDPEQHLLVVTTPGSRTVTWDPSMQIPEPLSLAGDSPFSLAAILGG